MRVVARLSSIVAVSVIGTVLVTAGVVMLLTPGPGLLAIVAGLAVLAREFRWARRLLDRARARVLRGRGDHRRSAQPLPAPPPAGFTDDDTPTQQHVA